VELGENMDLGENVEDGVDEVEGGLVGVGEGVLVTVGCL
jgi:hypothetical protein